MRVCACERGDHGACRVSVIFGRRRGVVLGQWCSIVCGGGFFAINGGADFFVYSGGEVAWQGVFGFCSVQS